MISLVTNAVTTISTNIATAGTLTVDLTSTLTGDVTMSGGNSALILTHANNATSTIKVGCMATYATSTATLVHLLFHASSTISSVVSGETASGYVIWGYGNCGNVTSN